MADNFSNNNSQLDATHLGALAFENDGTYPVTAINFFEFDSVGGPSDPTDFFSFEPHRLRSFTIDLSTSNVPTIGFNTVVVTAMAGTSVLGSYVVVETGEDGTQEQKETLQAQIDLYQALFPGQLVLNGELNGSSFNRPFFEVADPQSLSDKVVLQLTSVRVDLDNLNAIGDVAESVSYSFNITPKDGIAGGDDGSENGGMASLASVFAAQNDTAKGLAAAYAVLLGGVPNEAGFKALIEAAVSTNFGAGAGPVFNEENIFINLVNNLVQGNGTAQETFNALAEGSTLAEKIGALYTAIVPPSAQTAEGLAFLTRSEGIAFYQQVAAERGVAGDDGAAIIAMASLLRIVVAQDIGIGNAVNDLLNAVAAGSHAIPATGSVFTNIEIADGAQFDGDDGASGWSVAAATAFTYGDGIVDLAEPLELVGTTGAFGVDEM